MFSPKQFRCHLDILSTNSQEAECHNFQNSEQYQKELWRERNRYNLSLGGIRFYWINYAFPIGKCSQI